jgi:hypothetical protein
MMEPNKKPVRTVKSGGLRVSVWKNIAENGKVYYTVSPQKRYTKDDGQTWENTNSYNNREAILLADLLREASWWIRTNLEIDAVANKFLGR